MYNQRDCCQFIRYSDFKNSPGSLAREVIQELPEQITNYYRNHGILPNPVIEEEKELERTSKYINDCFYKCKLIELIDELVKQGYEKEKVIEFI